MTPMFFLLPFLSCLPCFSFSTAPPLFSFFLSMPFVVPAWVTITSLPTGPREPYGQCQQPHESRRQPHGLRHDHQQPRPQLPAVCWAAAAVLGQGWPRTAIHPAGHVRPAQLPRQRGLRGQVSRAGRGSRLQKWWAALPFPHPGRRVRFKSQHRASRPVPCGQALALTSCSVITSFKGTVIPRPWSPCSRALQHWVVF